MTIESVMEVFQAALLVALKLAAPTLIISIVVGLIISIFQAATQINEQTLTFVPKLLAIVAILFIMGPWMLETMIDFIKYIFEAALTLV